MTKKTVRKKQPAVTRKKARVPKTALEMLGVIRQFMSVHVYDKEGAKIWDILSALRGPDSDDVHTKAATTSVIRYHAIGKLAGQFSLVGPDNESKCAFRLNEMNRNGEHFWRHAWSAFRALGLKWGEVNP